LNWCNALHKTLLAHPASHWTDDRRRQQLPTRLCSWNH